MLADRKTTADSEDQNDKVLVLSLDVDGCLFHQHPDNKNASQESIHQWLIDNNKPLLEFIINLVKSKGYKRVIIKYGTNRQDESLDHDNGYTGKTGSCVPVLPILQSYLSHKLSCEVLLDPFWMADIYEAKGTPGASYKRALQYIYQNQNHHVPRRSWILDNTKASIHYADSHRTALLNPQATIDVAFFDDRDDILTSGLRFTKAHAKLFPNRVTHHFYKYDGSNKPSLKGSRKGEKEGVDERFHWTLRYLASMCANMEITGKRANIKTSKELQDYHESEPQGYDKHGRDRKMDLAMSFENKDKESLLNFLSKEISKLEPYSVKNIYTTAQALFNEGLIPERFVITSAKKERRNMVLPSITCAVLGAGLFTANSVANNGVAVSWGMFSSVAAAIPIECWALLLLGSSLWLLGNVVANIILKTRENSDIFKSSRSFSVVNG